MDKTPEQPRPLWVQVLGKTALMALPTVLVLGLIIGAANPPEWVSRAVVVVYAAIVIAAMLVALWLVVRAEDEGGPSGP